MLKSSKQKIEIKYFYPFIPIIGVILTLTEKSEGDIFLIEKYGQLLRVASIIVQAISTMLIILFFTKEI